MVTREASEILVIGAGLAGAACARALACAGYRVLVLEANSAPAMGASGNPLAIVHPLFSKDHNRASRWLDQGMLRSMQWARDLGVRHDSCGVLQLAQTDQDDLDYRHPRSDLLEYWDNNQVADFLGHHRQRSADGFGGLWCPKGGWVSPTDFVTRCLEDAQHHGAEIVLNAPIMAVDLNRRYAIGADAQEIGFQEIVFCAAQSTDALIGQAQLTLHAIRGTVTAIDCAGMANVIDRGLPAVICADGYATPVVDDIMVVGASYERLNDSALLEEHVATQDFPAQQPSNLDRLKEISPVLGQACRSLPQHDRTSIRSATRDRLPLVGQILDWRIPLSPSISQLHQMPRMPHAWICSGLGSRGLSIAALGAECITAMIAGRPLPVAPDLAKAVDPVRFALRGHQRREA